MIPLLPALKSAASWLLSALAKHPWQTACLLLLCASVWLWRGWDAEKAGRKDDAAKVAAAQQKATTDQIIVNHVPAAKSQAIAEKSNAEAQSYYEEGRRAGLAYADAHRVRAQTACPISDADLPGADRPAAVDDGSGVASGMVALSQADFDLLTGNSLRLAKVHQDAESLITAGVAVASVQP
jgi:hypothetical protein